ncbi:succinate--CoA ligase subunit alpha, partial [Candidatus Daviesbacteria bacterium]|nr:succinate--CoA ligase subunit alpha [Candidatus Daviesbacteria bacterium]
YEERVGEMKKAGKITKPVVAFIAGEFTLNLPSQVQFGHAGAIIEGDRGRPDYKRKSLRENDVIVADDFDQIAGLLKGAI